MSKSKAVDGEVVVVAAPNLGGVSFHEDLGLTNEQYQELKYGSGESSVSATAAEWLIKHGHAAKKGA